MPLIRKPSTPAPGPTLDAVSALAALENGSDDERWAAARVAGDMPGGVQALGRALAREPDRRVREAIFTGLARAASDESVEVVVSFLRSDDAQLRTGALDALQAMKGAVRSQVPRLLRDDDIDVRLLACELARNLPGDDATRLLCELLEEETEPNVCASALEVLGEVGGPAALP